MTVWFTSDLHFGHANIIKYCNRPWATVELMNAALIANWNGRVSPDDVVWVLGDVALGKIAESLPLVGQLNGHLRLVAGNHDRVWSGNGKKFAGWMGRYIDAGFEFVAESTWTSVAGVPVQLNHFPFAGDSHEEDRHVEHRPADIGQWLLHGHVHDTWRVNGRQINVGCDVWDYAPVSEDTLAEILLAA